MDAGDHGADASRPDWWQREHSVPRALRLEVAESGLRAHVSLTRPAIEISLELLAVLRDFARPTRPATLFPDPAQQPARQRLVADLRGAGLLIPCQSPSDNQLPSGVLQQHRMLADRARVLAYKHAIEATCKGRVVAEIGCGTGLLSILAARAGANVVYAVEQGGIAGLAEEMVRRNGCQDRVRILRGHSRDIELPEKAEVLIHELFGSDPFAENLLPSLLDVQRRWLRPDCLLLPDRLEIFATALSVEKHVFYGLTPGAARTDISELERCYGVDLAAHGARIDALVQSEEVDGTGATVLSDTCCVLELDLTRLDATVCEMTHYASLPMRRGGSLAGLRLAFQASFDHEQAFRSDGPDSHWVPFERMFLAPIEVEAGARVPLQLYIEHGAERGRLVIDVPWK